MRRLALALSLTACASAEPAPGTAVIEVSSGSFFGSQSTRIFADGTVISVTSKPGQASVRTLRHGTPAAYDRAAAVLAAEGAKTLRAQKPQALQCLDYGTDLVAATPPVGGFASATSACPDAAVSALMSAVLPSLATP